jgi:hypothetical protein
MSILEDDFFNQQGILPPNYVPEMGRFPGPEPGATTIADATKPPPTATGAPATGITPPPPAPTGIPRPEGAPYSQTIFGDPHDYFGMAVNSPLYQTGLHNNNMLYQHQMGNYGFDRQSAANAQSAISAGAQRAMADAAAQHGFTLQALANARAAASEGAQMSAAAIAAENAADAARAAHEQAVAERKKGLDIQTMREVMASRGSFWSGQTEWERQEHETKFGEFVTGLMLELQGRGAARASRQAEINANLKHRLAGYDLDEAEANWKKTSAEGAAQDRMAQAAAEYNTTIGNIAHLEAWAGHTMRTNNGNLLLETATAFTNPASPLYTPRPAQQAIWNPQYGHYATPDGRLWNEHGEHVSWVPGSPLQQAWLNA